ncbi:MAG: twin-arginine translocase TatA/TatE family subunit [Armatimonadetes bacterium]|nr:twin-arginine translocase TatA/TatE family subunit [Armatimonadota bacterium]MDE2206091.1 twin-arginine translocase TatA/TatE family subunit [Armatimonadota bacterium]
MLAFFDSPIQLVVVMIVLLLVFGPQKLPEIGQQLGRALRELKKVTHEFSSSLTSEEPWDAHRDTPSWQHDPYADGHGGTSDEQPRTESWRGLESGSEYEPWQPGQIAPPVNSHGAPLGDYASPALADPDEPFGAEHRTTAPATPPAPVTNNPPTGAVPR